MQRWPITTAIRTRSDANGTRIAASSLRCATAIRAPPRVLRSGTWRCASTRTSVSTCASSPVCVVTHDADFLRMAHELVEQGEHHVGVLFILCGTDVGDAIRAIALAPAVFEPEELQDSIEWIA